MVWHSSQVQEVGAERSETKPHVHVKEHKGNKKDPSALFEKRVKKKMAETSVRGCLRCHSKAQGEKGTKGEVGGHAAKEELKSISGKDVEFSSHVTMHDLASHRPLTMLDSGSFTKSGSLLSRRVGNPILDGVWTMRGRSVGVLSAELAVVWCKSTTQDQLAADLSDSMEDAMAASLSAVYNAEEQATARLFMFFWGSCPPIPPNPSLGVEFGISPNEGTVLSEQTSPSVVKNSCYGSSRVC
eukprot:2941649-Amphidinium_carterae.1